MRFKTSILFITSFGFNCFTGFAQKRSGTVVLHGIAINFNNQIQVADLSEFAGFSLPNLKRTFLTDSAGRFSISFKLDRPNYFKLGRNVLFLSPGDSLDVYIDYNYPLKGRFEGKGAEANTYLKNTSFPKGGSFLQSGVQIANTFENTLINIMTVAKRREDELQSYKNVSDKFKILETGRIKADIINSLNNIRYYYKDEIKNEDTLILFKNTYDREGAPLIKKYSSGFYNAEFLKLEVYRDILDIIEKNSPGRSGKLNDQKRIKDWEYANAIAYKIKSTANKDSIKALKEAIDKIATISYKSPLKNTYNKKLAFGNGDPAKIFIASNEKNEKASLGEFKGKVIYLDLWATWCGPCLEEIPWFNQLKEKYKNSRDIVFISLSIDTDIKEWKGELTSRNMTGNQWIINRLKLNDYSVAGVPRTIIIDKNFNVFEMEGPRPSSKKTEEIIERLLK